MRTSRTGMFVTGTLAFGLAISLAPLSAANAQAEKRPNIVMLMTDDTGWNDFGPYSGGGLGLGHPTPNVDQLAKEGAVLTNWYGQASCTAGRASFITGRIPIRTALSIVVAPGDENYLRPETPTIAEFFKKNGYTTYFSGKWHLGDKPISFPIEHGFDEMKNFAAYYAGVYAYDDTSRWFHPWFPSYNPAFAKAYSENVNLNEYEGVAGQPAKSVGKITFDSMATFDERQADSAVAYIKAHANGDALHARGRGVYTHTVPVDAYRGARRPEAAYVLERLVDRCARTLGLQPEEIRARNFVKSSQMPYKTQTGRTYDVGDFEGALRACLVKADYAGFAGRAKESKSRGLIRGVGMSSYIECTAFDREGETGSVVLQESGDFTVLVGTQSTGQGHETAYAQVVSQTLDVPLSRIKVVQDDTDRVASGFGTGGSRSIPVGAVMVDRFA